MKKRSEHLPPYTYTIKVDGCLDRKWADWFEGMTFVHESDGTTVLCGPLADQAALHGLLNGIRDLGLALISVQQTNLNRKEKKETHYEY